MLTLALDVDGVLLDPDRSGDGHWTNELNRRFAITRDDLRRTFFMDAWDDVVSGRRAIEPALRDSLTAIGSTADVETVLACWFDTDFVLVDPAVDLARRAVAAGVRIVLATNQEHRRARYLHARLGELFAIEATLYSAEVGVQKHEPGFFELATAALAADPDDVVFVDDAQLNVDRAGAAGWNAVLGSPDAAWITHVERLLGLDPSR